MCFFGVLLKSDFLRVSEVDSWEDDGESIICFIVKKWLA